MTVDKRVVATPRSGERLQGGWMSVAPLRLAPSER
jgi:hypothetical protein